MLNHRYIFPWVILFIFSSILLYFGWGLCVWGFGPVVRAARRFAVGEPSSSVQSVAASCSTEDAPRNNAELAISH